MQNRIGAIFDAIVTGVTPKGTFVRVLQPRVDGLLAQGQQGVDVGDRFRVKLIRTDVQHGFIDFARVRFQHNLTPPAESSTASSKAIPASHPASYP